MFLKNLWYMGCLSKELKTGKMISKTLLGEPIVFARGGDGKAFALKNICPHRGIPFHYGDVTKNEVQCPYHGWKFKEDGVCTHIPSLTENQNMDCTKIRVKSYPIKEKGGMIWFYFSDEKFVSSTELPPLPMVSRLTTSTPGYVLKMDFKCSMDHAVIGLMDPAHGPFVHKSWFWRNEKSIHSKKKQFAPSDPMGFKMVRHPPSSNAKMYKLLGGQPTTEITFQLPGLRLEHIEVGRKNIFGLTCLTPIDENRTQIYHLMFWDLKFLWLFKPIIQYFGKIFMDQDRVAIERQQEGLKFSPSLMLIEDADTQAKWYFKLKTEFEKSRNENRTFQNPVPEKLLEWRS